MARSHPPTTPTPVEGLNPHDPGVLLLSEAVAQAPAREILLVCSGDVPGVGPDATRWTIDIREREGSRARAVPMTMTAPAASETGAGHAIVWPRSHLGKDFTFACLARGALALRPGGTLWCAARKTKGASSIIDEIATLMGEVDVVGRSRGYRLLRARKGERFDSAHAHARIATRYTIEDPALGELSLAACPGVFSRKALDAGTRQLIEFARQHAQTPQRVIDLCCGVGPLGLWAARHWPQSRVLAVDSNTLAVGCASDNAIHNALQSRVTVLTSDGLAEPLPPAALPFRGATDLALVNPPTHADPSTLRALAAQLVEWLGPGGTAMLVVNRAGRMQDQLQAAGARVRVHEVDGYRILQTT